MSSKESSKIKVLHNNKVFTVVKFTDNKMHIMLMSFVFIATLWQTLILYYLYNLEGDECKCEVNWKTDWRHSYLKYLTIFLLFCNICKLVFSVMYFPNTTLNFILTILYLVNLYAFFTYIRELNIHKCKCAIEKQYVLNKTMLIVAWLSVILFVVGFLYGLYNSTAKMKV